MDTQTSKGSFPFSLFRAILLIAALLAALMGSGKVHAQVCGEDHIVAEGESLSRISEVVYGDVEKWTIIYNVNLEAIGDNPNLILIGQRLRIPCLEESIEPILVEQAEETLSNDNDTNSEDNAAETASAATNTETENTTTEASTSDSSSTESTTAITTTTEDTTADVSTTEGNSLDSSTEDSSTEANTTTEDATADDSTTESSSLDSSAEASTTTEAATAEASTAESSSLDSSTETSTTSEAATPDASSTEGNSLDSSTEASTTTEDATADASATESSSSDSSTDASTTTESAVADAATALSSSTTADTTTEDAVVTDSSNSESSATESANGDAIKFLTADDYAPFTDRKLINGGMVTDMLVTALENHPDKPAFDVNWINDWSQHLDPLLTTLEYDLGFPWLQPDCVSEPDDYRCQNFNFSNPVIHVLVLLFTDKERPLVFNKDSDIKGAVLCRPNGYYTHDLEKDGRQWLTNNVIELKQPSSIKDCFDMLMAGEVDAVTLNEYTGRSAVSDLSLSDRVEVLENQPLSIEGLHVVVHKQHPRAQELINIVNDSMTRIQLTPEYNSIVDMHFSRFWSTID